MQPQDIIYHPIGIIHSPHTIPSETPIAQGRGGCQCCIKFNQCIYGMKESGDA